MDASVHFRWLGVAGVEFKAGDQILAIDPFFTRPPLWHMWFGRVSPNRALSVEKVPRCQFVLVTHPHHDHLMDVADVARHTGAAVYGSPNACRILAASSLPQEQIHEIGYGAQLTLGGFEIQVLPGGHGKTPLDRIINAPLPPSLRLPLRLTDYRMDACFSFLVRVNGVRLLRGDHPVPADVLLIYPHDASVDYRSLLQKVQPRLVIPIHWDDFFSPLSKPIRPMLTPPTWAIPPTRRVNLDKFKQVIEALSPGTKVLIPEIFSSYDLNSYL